MREVKFNHQSLNFSKLLNMQKNIKIKILCHIEGWVGYSTCNTMFLQYSLTLDFLSLTLVFPYTRYVLYFSSVFQFILDYVKLPYFPKFLMIHSLMSSV